MRLDEKTLTLEKLQHTNWTSIRFFCCLKCIDPTSLKRNYDFDISIWDTWDPIVRPYNKDWGNEAQFAVSIFQPRTGKTLGSPNSEVVLEFQLKQTKYFGPKWKPLASAIISYGLDYWHDTIKTFSPCCCCKPALHVTPCFCQKKPFLGTLFQHFRCLQEKSNTLKKQDLALRRVLKEGTPGYNLRDLILTVQEECEMWSHLKVYLKCCDPEQLFLDFVHVYFMLLGVNSANKDKALSAAMR